MKIGITCYPTYGGSGAVATELGIQLAERGHEVHFISYAQPFRLGHFRERVFFHEVEMDQYPLFEHPPYSLALAVAMTWWRSSPASLPTWEGFQRWSPRRKPGSSFPWVPWRRWPRPGVSCFGIRSCGRA